MADEREEHWEGSPPPTDVRESDPNEAHLHGEGGMGVSSERLDEDGQAYGAEPTRPESGETGDAPPEQSSDPASIDAEVHPDDPAQTNRADPSSKPGLGL